MLDWFSCVFPTVISNLLQLPWRLSSQAIVRLLVVFKINEKAIGVNVFILLLFSFFLFFYPRFPEGSCVMSYGFLSHNPFNTFNPERRKPLVITDFAWHSSLLAPTPVTIQDAEVFEVRWDWYYYYWQKTMCTTTVYYHYNSTYFMRLNYAADALKCRLLRVFLPYLSRLPPAEEEKFSCQFSVSLTSKTCPSQSNFSDVFSVRVHLLWNLFRLEHFGTR